MKFEIIENTDEAQDKFGHCYGSGQYIITKEHVEALLNNKQLATTINGGEYSIFIKYMEVEE